MRYRGFKSVWHNGFEFLRECSKCHKSLDLVNSSEFAYCPFCGKSLNNIPKIIPEEKLLLLVNGMAEGRFNV